MYCSYEKQTDETINTRWQKKGLSNDETLIKL